MCCLDPWSKQLLVSRFTAKQAAARQLLFDSWSRIEVLTATVACLSASGWLTWLHPIKRAFDDWFSHDVDRSSSKWVSEAI